MISYLSNIKRILAACVLSGILFSCESVKREPLDESSLPAEVSFEEHILPVFQEKCIKCHNATPPELTADDAYLNLTGGGFINVDRPEDSRLYETINTGGKMQQYANDLDRALILKWITQGAFDN